MRQDTAGMVSPSAHRIALTLFHFFLPRASVASPRSCAESEPHQRRSGDREGRGAKRREWEKGQDEILLERIGLSALLVSLPLSHQFPPFHRRI